MKSQSRIGLAALTCGGFFAFLFVGAFSHSSVAAAPREQQTAKQVYLDKCSVCHGEDGAGKTAKGRKLNIKDIRDPEVQKMSPADWTNIILKGKGQDMDGFEKELGADMCKKLAAYMRDMAKK